MQNAPAMLAQKMMSRQAPYGPVGMVSQNMSGNKKVSSPYMSVSASVSPIAVGKYDVYVFNASGTFTVRSLGPDPTEGSKVEYLVIAGGGAGARDYGGGGGGAGGYLTASGFSVAAQTYAITVGAGGADDTSGTSSVFSSIAPIGGGGKSSTGGSGAGGTPLGIGFFPGFAGTAGQGFGGGQCYNDGAFEYAGGGGGGAGGVGQSIPVTNVGGAGGVGLASSITGVSIPRAGGGAGIGFAANGGPSSFGGGSPGIQALVNRGGGGSAVQGTSVIGNGGSGVVIIKVRARA